MTSPRPPVGLFKLYGRAIAAVGRNLFGVLLLFGVLGALGGVVQHFLLAWGAHVVQDWLPRNDLYLEGQQAFMVAQLVAFLPMLVYMCVVGAIAVPWSVRFFQMAESGSPVSWEGVIEFGFKRFKRVLWPYTQATLAIQLGSIIVVPGILFALFYAFVGPVAVLDDAVKRPLARSTKLTRGRRGRLFRAGLVFAPWLLWYGLVGSFQAAEWGVGAVVAMGVVDELFSLVLFLVVFQMYEERMSEVRELLEARRKADAEAAESD